jgi:hypothetical protein
MADKKISALTAAALPLAGTEVLPIVQSGATVKVAVSDLTAGRSISVSGLTNTGLTASQPVFTDASKLLTSTGVVPVANGGTNASSASITAFNNITGYTAAGATGTTSTNLVFSTSPTLTTPKATTTIGVGNATPSASGSGISFPATQSASTDANTLDDYEEGTWTPDFISTGLTITPFTLNGKYTKVGNIVNASFYVQITSTSGTLTNPIELQGLPFAAVTGTDYGFSCAIGVHQFTLTPSIFLGAGATKMNIYQDGTITALTGAALASGFYLGTITYQTN